MKKLHGIITLFIDALHLSCAAYFNESAEFLNYMCQFIETLLLSFHLENYIVLV